MMGQEKNNLNLKNVRGELSFDEPMSKHTSWRVGGPAAILFKPEDVSDLQLFLSQQTTKLPIYWVGLGSNLLVRDGGIEGVVILTQGMLVNLSCENKTQVYAEAGVPCPKVAKFAVKNDLQGAEFLAGIPGTIGGALAMNAGAFGGETWEKVISVETLNAQGQRITRKPNEYNIAYRQVDGPKDEWFLSARFQFQVGDGKKSLENMKALLEKRNKTQPTNQPSCGSVFRNPPKDHAARLIEASGLKGYCIGGACVSDKHANFIVNTGNATAHDIESLINEVKQKVFKTFGVDLIREAHIVGVANA